ncbi:peptide-methionine (S)-S-oxide reductase MsrA [Chitinophaga sedimenti]|uniref:peptide-methionine (S)-S-oxide reductase MsrA n=1 Tax=Chitinophaga sedimenti TaxID=2033606 RepID=UPI002005E348|nr:peptide-methionine (S)-S-oxide reductase MsrA [Chitinophaga sedimenti]MCK7553945.1 peptide-methionine (S)-S-oxide reductase MsrA [Chitinophaga sedimenti]
MEVKDTDSTAVATFGGGCFWCTEAQFQYLEGVLKVESGYMGGHVANPTYEDVCTGNTGHAEVIRVTYDPRKIDYPTLLEAFWISHDPTTLNRQGNDVGTQYRSVIFYHNKKQHEEAEFYKKKLGESGSYKDPIVTEIAKKAPFTRRRTITRITLTRTAHSLTVTMSSGRNWKNSKRCLRRN